jgi:hypothetical protein
MGFLTASIVLNTDHLVLKVTVQFFHRLIPYAFIKYSWTISTVNSERIWNIALCFKITRLTTHDFTTLVTEQLASSASCTTHLYAPWQCGAERLVIYNRFNAWGDSILLERIFVKLYFGMGITKIRRENSCLAEIELKHRALCRNT